jgi:hypothetical protein
MTPICLLRWTFKRGDQSITCQLEASPVTPTYRVYVVPHWDVGASVVEGTRTQIDAYRRHAEIAMWLRDAGWSRVPHCNGHAY